MCDLNCKKEKGILKGLFIGGLISAAAYYLLATENGKKIQKELAKKGKKAASHVQDLIAELEEKSLEFKDKAEEVAAAIQEKTEEKIGLVSEGAREKIETGLDTAFEKIGELQDHGRKLTDSIHSDLKKKFFKNLPNK